jgi:hypothetical protein
MDLGQIPQSQRPAVQETINLGYTLFVFGWLVLE